MNLQKCRTEPAYFCKKRVLDCGVCEHIRKEGGVRGSSTESRGSFGRAVCKTAADRERNSSKSNPSHIHNTPTARDLERSMHFGDIVDRFNMTAATADAALIKFFIRPFGHWDRRRYNQQRTIQSHPRPFLTPPTQQPQLTQVE